MLVERLGLRPVRPGEWRGRCPVHQGTSNNSLKVTESREGVVLVHCFGGCGTEAVVASADLSMGDLFSDSGRPAVPLVASSRDAPTFPVAASNGGHDRPRRLVGTTRYPIRDESGTTVAVHVRDDYDDGSKRVWWQRPDGQSGLGGLPSADLPLYGIQEIGDADEVIGVEGEPARDAVRGLGVTAVGTVTGAEGCPSDDRLRPLIGRTVYLWPDHDAPGRSHMDKVGRRLLALGMPPAAVRVIEWADAPEKGDAADWVAAGGTAEGLRALLSVAPGWEPATAAAGGAPSEQGAATAPVPAFPIEVLPSAVRRYVAAAAASIPVPVGMVAVPMLGFAGALIGNRLRLVLKASYHEYLSLYLAIVAPPGTAKSPALKLAQSPLDVLQRRAMKAYRERLAAYEADLERWKAQKPDERGEKPRPPVLRHYYSTNLTIEALVGMLEHSPGVAIVRDEVLSWVRSMDQYRGGKGSDRQEYLSLWSSATVKSDRKGGGTIYRPFPVACVVGGIQPDFAADLHDEAQRRDGFVERLLPLVLPLGATRWTEETIDPALAGDVLAVFEALDRLPPADIDADPARPAGIGVELHPDAKTLWVRWHDENAELVERAGGLAGGFYRKLSAHVARFALILHALWHPDDPRPMVSAARMADAIEVGEFFRAHIDRFLPLLGAGGAGKSAGLSARILRILRISEGDDDGWVSRSDILNRLRTVPADELTAALDSLRDAGSVERRTVAGATKRTEQWRLQHRNDSFGDSDYSEHGRGDAPAALAVPVGAGESPNTPNSESGGAAPTGPDPALRAMAREIVGATAEERAAFRIELDAEPANDPEAVLHRRALALAERMLAGDEPTAA